MNHCVPDWSMEDDLRFHDLLPLSNQKNSVGADNDLVELLWRNGHVVMQSQTSRKPPLTIGEQKQASKYESPPKYTGGPLSNSSTLIQEDETASWFQYPLGDSLDKEFCSEFFSEMPTVDTLDANKLNKDVMIEEDRSNLFTMPPPKSRTTAPTQLASSLENVGVVNFSHFSRPMKTDLGSLKLGNGVVVRMGESSSMRTVGSTACGSNQVQNQPDASHTVSNGASGTLVRGAKEGIQMSSPREGVQTNTFDGTVTSSSGGSGCSFGRNAGQQSASNQTHKRKGRDGEDSECHSEEADYESTEPNRPSQRSASARKSRAAEVHNLSERRRRDRINEKMKALQELIPHCNKSDKASMLDEAIEYLKSLQLQLQIMWMGSGMAPMMFPAVQQYMSRVGIGMGHASSIPSINSMIQLQRGPLVNHSMSSTPSTNQMPMCASPSLNAVNFPNQMMQNAHHPESYAHCLGFPHMQLPPQTMNLYNYGSHMVPQNQTAGAAGSSGLPTSGVPSGNIQNGQSG